MELWDHWLRVAEQLRPACARTRTFLWLLVVLIAMTTRADLAGVTSFVRCHWLHARFYDHLRKFFHSPALPVDRLAVLWVALCLKVFAPHLVRIHGRVVLIADGIKVPKEGKKMPAVKSLHQESQSNSRPTYIMGHSCQTVALLVQGSQTYFAVPLNSRIHEGPVFTNRSCQTLLDKLVTMLLNLAIDCPFYLVADAYYASKKVALPVLKHDQHLLVRIRSNAVAYKPVPRSQQPARGRPRKYGRKLLLRTQFLRHKLCRAASAVCGEKSVDIYYHSLILLWKPLGRRVQFVVVEHPLRGRMILMTTDLTLDPLDAIKLYGLRFKIEVRSKQAVHTLGTYGYHFWMQAMKPIRKGDGNQYLHPTSENYRQRVKIKLNAYHRHIQIGLIAQGLMQYLALAYPALVWKSFGSWLRTMKPDLEPSEMVVGKALSNQLPQFLINLPGDNMLRIFLQDKLAPDRCPPLLLAAFSQAA